MKRLLITLSMLAALAGSAHAQAPRTDKQWTIQTIALAPPYDAPAEVQATTTAAAKKEAAKRLGAAPTAAQAAIINGMAQPGTARWAEWLIAISPGRYVRVVYHFWAADLASP